MLVVQGITTDGKRFRPSSWTDMLVGRYTCPVTWANVSRAETQHCRTISKYIQVCSNANGFSEIRVSENLAQYDPYAYEHIKRFAITNNLIYTEGGDFSE